MVLEVSNQNDIKVCKSPRIKNVAIHSQWLNLFVVHNKTQHYFKKDETTLGPCSTFEKDIDEGHEQDNIRKDTFIHIFCNFKLYMIMKMWLFFYPSLKIIIHLAISSITIMKRWTFSFYFMDNLATLKLTIKFSFHTNCSTWELLHKNHGFATHIPSKFL